MTHFPILSCMLRKQRYNDTKTYVFKQTQHYKEEKKHTAFTSSAVKNTENLAWQMMATRAW